MKSKNPTTSGLLWLAVCLWLARPAAAQVVNPGFETAGANAASASGWSIIQAAGGPVFAVRTNDNPHGGAFNFEVHLASVGAGPVVEFGQTGVPVIGGANYTFSFYANRLSSSISDNHSYNVQWFTSNSVLISQSGYIGYNPGANAYAQTVVNLVAPATAGKANFSFYTAGGANPAWTATILFDDVSLTTTNTSGGGGTTPVTNHISASLVWGKGVTWFASNSVAYQVQWATSTNAGWTNLGNQIIGNGATNTVFDPATPAHNFYQVLSIQ